MNIDDLPPGITHRQLADADHMDTLTDDHGDTYRFLEDPVTDEVHLTPNECLDWGRLHPLNKGMVGFVGTLLAFLAPIALVTLLDTSAITDPIPLGGPLLTLGAVLGGYALARIVFYRTTIGEWLWLFLEYRDVQHILTVEQEGAL